MGVLIDTDVLIAWERGDRQLDFSRWSSFGAAHVSVITVSELLVGAHAAGDESRRKSRLAFAETTLQYMTILDINVAIARRHAEIRAELQKRGTPIGLHDTWIAATAQHAQMPVLTTNTKDFLRIPNLQVLDGNVDGER